MHLILENGYPFPLPEGFDSDAYDCRNEALTLSGVTTFEWLHTVTIGFATPEDRDTAQKLTGWQKWNDLVLEAHTSGPDGYTHPAIVVKNLAFCGFILVDGSP